jgi:hypothetical protein
MIIVTKDVVPPMRSKARGWDFYNRRLTSAQRCKPALPKRASSCFGVNDDQTAGIGLTDIPSFAV